jgi:hypothetical protein
MKIKESVDQDEILRREMEAFEIYRWELETEIATLQVDWSAATADPGYIQWALKLEAPSA